MTASSPQWAAHYTTDRMLDVRVAKADRARGVVALLTAESLTAATWTVGDASWRPTAIPLEDLEAAAWLSADGRALFRLADDDGNELGHVARVDLDDSERVVDLTPGWDPYTTRCGDCSLDGSLVAFSAIDADGYRLVTAPADGSGEPKVIFRTTAEAWSPRVSADARYVSMDTTDHNPGKRRWAVSVFDTASGERVATLADPDGGSIQGVCFAPAAGDARVLVAASHRSDGFCRPEIWDPRSGEVVALPVAVPHPDAEITPLDWSPDGRYVLLGTQVYAEQSLSVLDLATGEAVDVDVPRGSFWSPYHHSCFGPDGCVLALHSDTATPLGVWRWTRGGGGAEQILRSPAVPSGHRATSVTFPSEDGVTIQAWLVTPDGPGPHPAVVSVHGGPHWYIGDEYNPDAQAWVDEGFAFLDVNFRGSLGRGRAFTEQIWGDLGRLELADVAAGRDWLVRQGIARPDQVFITGASYGGYMTLYALGRQPDLWAGGFAVVATADWAEEYHDISAALQGAVRGWFGGTPDELPDLYRERSPVTYAADVRAPLVVAQALNDTRVAPGQMRTYLAKMESLGKDITVRWIGGGHTVPPGDEWRAQMELFLATARRALAGSGEPLRA